MIEPSGFREIVRSATITYPIPFLSALCFAFAALVLGGALLAGNPLRWVFVAFAGISALFAIALIAFSVLRRLDLLRSEQHQIAQRMLDMAGDDLTPQTIEGVGRLLAGEQLLEEDR